MELQFELDDPEVYNLEYLSMVTGDDNGMMQELATHIFTDSPLLVSDALQSASKNDWISVAAILHKLKGQLGILSMKKTMDTIVELEILCKKPYDMQEKMSSGLKGLECSIPLIFNRIQQEIGYE